MGTMCEEHFWCHTIAEIVLQAAYSLNSSLFASPHNPVHTEADTCILCPSNDDTQIDEESFTYLQEGLHGMLCNLNRNSSVLILVSIQLNDIAPINCPQFINSYLWFISEKYSSETYALVVIFLL